ncbi:glucokinase [Streptomyces sp. CB02959]|uniref:ROK family protein n=1 Tax=Streptomyces sp. CB02959 TaxID=2020330 RepID=UPI000C27C069|nr:ROK family protein [Streptomyces sp. CB02959]PJN36204.1 glucokinase [Streptomyces sp. CB02959]
MLNTPVPVLEVGGTHVTAALVDQAARELMGEAVREPLPAQGSAGEILGGIAAAAARIEAPPGACWGVAMPGPFDYEAGIGLFKGVGKFESLYGVDVGAELKRRLHPAPATLRFLNDADAFGIGEAVAGAAVGHARSVCITLGSGVGSAFLDQGQPVNDGPLVPPDGSVHLLSYGGRPLEETVSRRGIRAAYARAALDDPDVVPDVRAIAELARAGDRHAWAVLDHAFRALGAVLAPWLARFEATALVVGGSIAASWDLIEGPLRAGVDAVPHTGLGGKMVFRTAEHPCDAPLLGAAWWAARPQPATAGGR